MPETEDRGGVKAAESPQISNLLLSVTISL